jgi:hypothetical protein
MIHNILKPSLFFQGKYDRSVSVKSTEEFANLCSQFSTIFIYDPSVDNPSFTEHEGFFRM